MRSILTVATTVTGLSLLALDAGCFPEADCNAVCETTFGVSAHVPGTAASLGGASVTFCRNGACASATFAAASDAGTVTSAALTGAPFSADAQVSDGRDGFSVVGISLHVSGLTLSDGDVYSVKVADSTGKTLLDVSRPVTYDVVKSCGATTCQEYSMDVYPSSVSGITCGDKSCISGATLSGTLTSSDTHDPVTVSLCRNTTCGSLVTGLPASASDGVQGNVSGPLGAGVDIQQAQSGQKFPFQIYVYDVPAALSDADTYTLTITHGATTLASWSGLAPYQKSFPNGPQCDAFPCRMATIDVH
jgi:hypothetical protein